MSALGLEADTAARFGHVRFTPNSGHQADGLECPLSATSCQMRSNMHFYSITSSARASSVGEIVSPSFLAVFRLTIISNLLACSIGKSAGWAPLRILSKYEAARGYKSG